MPLQNRVAPSGEIFASARGTFMGNRGGAIHNDGRKIVRQYAGRRWITCLLEFKGRRRTVMSPGRYTELFFLDEAVALAAGHRPCAECRRGRFNAFKTAWNCFERPAGEKPPLADEMDRELHGSRIHRRAEKSHFRHPWSRCRTVASFKSRAAAIWYWETRWFSGRRRATSRSVIGPPVWLLQF